MTGWTLRPWNRRTKLENCPVGLFEWNGGLHLRTEYHTAAGRIDAYIVSSGEAFWGPAPQTAKSQRATMVRPVECVPSGSKLAHGGTETEQDA